MRWLFLLLLVLNLFYYVWHQQQTPLRVKEVESFALYQGGRQNIRLVSEADVAAIAEKPPNNARAVTMVNDKGAFGYATLANRTSEKLLLEKPHDHFQADAVAPLVVGISPRCGMTLRVLCDPFGICPRCAFPIFCLPLTRAA